MTIQQSNPPSPDPLLNYWFGQTAVIATENQTTISVEQYQLWRSLGAIHQANWQPDPAQDQKIQQLFADLLPLLEQGRLTPWLNSASACLAYILVADTLPRCFYRGQTRAYAFATQALEAALYGLKMHFEEQLSFPAQAFFYMPLTHAENPQQQQQSLDAYKKLSDQANHNDHNFYADLVKSSQRHHQIMTRFARFPNRNAALGRQSTSAENAYLNAPWTFFSADENAP